MQAAVRHRPRDQPVEVSWNGSHGRSGHFEEPLDLDRSIERERRDANGRAGVPTLVAEHLDHQIGGAVHDLGSIEESRRRIDEAAEPHDPHHLVEVAERGLDLGDEVDRAGAGRGLALLDHHVVAKLALGDQRAAGAEAELAGHHQQRSSAHKADIVGDRGGRRREGDTKSGELLFNLGHAMILYGLPNERQPFCLRQLLADCWPTASRLLVVDSWRTVGGLLVDSWWTLGGLLADCWPTLVRVLADRPVIFKLRTSAVAGGAPSPYVRSAAGQRFQETSSNDDI